VSPSVGDCSEHMDSGYDYSCCLYCLHTSCKGASAVQTLVKVRDANLQHTLQFGIGLHHAALPNTDRELVEELFCAQKIQVLVATSTLAWGVNTPAHLVIVKGTEFFDGKTKRCACAPCLAGCCDYYAAGHSARVKAACCWKGITLVPLSSLWPCVRLFHSLRLPCIPAQQHVAGMWTIPSPTYSR
jgi:hypothetical protein